MGDVHQEAGTDGAAFESAEELDGEGSDEDMEEESDDAELKEIERRIEGVAMQRDKLKGMVSEDAPYIRDALDKAEQELARLRTQRTARLSPVRLAHRVGNELDRCQKKASAAEKALNKAKEESAALRAQPDAIKREANERIKDIRMAGSAKLAMAMEEVGKKAIEVLEHGAMTQRCDRRLGSAAQD